MKKWYNIFLCITGFMLHIRAEQTQTIHRYLWANYHQFGGNLQTAQNWYKQLLNTHSSIYTLKGFVHFLAETGNFDQIAALIPQITDKFQNDPDLQLIFARAYHETKQLDKADELIITLNNKFETHPEIALYAIDIFVQRKALDNALYVIEKIINKSSTKHNHYLFYFAKGQIYVQLGKYEDALKNIELCLQKQPYFDKGWLLLALLQEQAGKLEHAIKGYATFLEINKEGNKQIEQHLLHLTMKQKNLNTSGSILLTDQSCFNKALILFERKQYQQALQMINQCLTQQNMNIEARLLKIEILYALHKYDDLLKQIHAWIDEDPSNTAWFKTLHLLTKMQVPIQSVIQTLEAVCTRHSAQSMPLLHLADLYLRTQQQAKALEMLIKATPLIQESFLKTTLLFQQGLLYYQQGSYEQAHKVLEEGYALAHDFPPLLNLLAYYYATKNKNYQRAQILIQRALEQDPHNAHFLDTQAVIMYKQKQYKQASEIQDKLIQHYAHDSTIMIHHAKIHHALGNTEQALVSLKTAQHYAHNQDKKNKIISLQQQWKTTLHE